jgi:hypothetical protein
MPPSLEGFGRNVFINCPFDADYIPLARILVFCVLRCGFQPRIATERSDSGEIRVDKIRELIRSSRFSIHDLSRMEPLGPEDLPRFNMPFELGLDLGCRYYGTAHLRSKQCLILEKERYRYQKVLSDISGNDIRAHHNDPEKLVEELRDWLRVSSGEALLPAAKLWEQLKLFSGQLKTLLQQQGYSERNVQSLEMAEYISFVKSWMSGGMA